MFRAESHATPVIDKAERIGRRARAWAVAVLAACAGFVSLWPYTAVVEAGRWSFRSIVVILAVAATGFLVRQLRTVRWSGGVWPMLAQVAVTVVMFTLLVLPQSALLGIIPTGATITTLGDWAAAAMEQVQFGTAPLAATPALGAMLVIGFAAVTVLVDQLVAARLTLMAIMVVAVTGALPMIVTLGDANVPWFVLLAVLALFLLRHSIRHDRRKPQRASVGVSLGVGAAAIAAALVVTPALPISATWIGAGTSSQLDPSLRLGEDLRRPTPFTVMTLATDAVSAPYLRVASLSEFDGETWAPDEGELQPAADGFGAPDWSDDIETVERRTSIRITGISGSWLPVPYAATKIVGVSSAWQAMPSNRTVTSENQDAADEDYTITAELVQPTREQIRAVSATRSSDAEVPTFIADTAREVTADAATDYDRLITMQNWFRSQFEYSLDAPVDGDFDGTGTEAVEEFLRQRSGYCIHFAGAFALMTQALEMQVRIVVGYLPGSLTDERRGDESIYTVSSDQLHAWPEVHFEGIGWVPFEPTASLGTPTDFLPATTAGGGSTTDPTAPEPSTAPSAAPTQAPQRDEDSSDDGATGSGPLQRLDPAPVVLVGAGILLVLLLPAVIRRGVRSHRMVRARRADAGAAWQEVRDTLVDLRIAVSDADTPRARGAELVERGADPAAVRTLVDAVERASYAPSAGADDVSTELAGVIADLRRSVDARDRFAAVLLPWSLVASRSSRPNEAS